MQATRAPSPKVHSDSYGLPQFCMDPDSEYKVALRRRNDWDPIVDRDIVVLGGRGGRKVALISDMVVVKYCCFDNQGEYHALKVISELGNLNVPKPVFHWPCGSSSRYAVAMTKVPGVPLDDDSQEFDPKVLRAVTLSLRGIISSIRVLTSHTIRGPGTRMVRAGLLRCHGLTFAGIDDGVALIEYVIKLYGTKASDVSILNVREAYSQYLDNLPGRREVFVMTHSDLHPNNVMIDQSGHEIKVGLVDWERASYMPLYWEHFCARMVNAIPSWEKAVVGAVDEYGTLVEAILDMMR